MGVGMKEAIKQDHLQHGIAAPLSQHPTVEPCPFDRSKVVTTHAGDVLLDVHHAARPLPVDARHQNVRVIRKVARKSLDVARLNREVQLTRERALKLRDDLHRLISPRLRHLPLDELRDVVEYPDVGVDLALDARPANFQNNWCAARQFCPVHLRDRGGRMGLALQIHKDLEWRAAECSLDLGQQVLEGYRRYSTLQPLKFG